MGAPEAQPASLPSRMKRPSLYLLGSLALLSWAALTYHLFLQRPSSQSPGRGARQEERNRHLEVKVEALEAQLKEQLRTNSLLLGKLVQLRGADQGRVDVRAVLDLLDNPGMELAGILAGQQELGDRGEPEGLKPEPRGHKPEPPGHKPEPLEPVVRSDKSREVEPHGNSDIKSNAVKGEDKEEGKEGEDKEEEEGEEEEDEEEADGDIRVGEEERRGGERPVIPLLLFSCNRPTVSRALDLLLSYRPSREQFPIIVSQDCGHRETQAVIQSYGDQVIYLQQPDLSEPAIPPKEKKFKGYFKIARHYGWALNKTFMEMAFDQVVVVEDDLEISPDFFEYFQATLPILRQDPSLWCVSAWNDNGKTGLIDEGAPEVLYRTDFFPGLGWMLTRDLWLELMGKWPRSYWDDWMREPQQRKGRSCIRPEVSRTKTFGKVGVSNGLFFEKHLKYIVLSTKFVPFTVMDLSFLTKERYDEGWVREVYRTPVVSLEDLRGGRVKGGAVRVTYHTREAYKKSAKALGIMDDFKSGVPRMAYRGIVSSVHRGVRVYLAPNTNWPGYDPKWA